MQLSHMMYISPIDPPNDVSAGDAADAAVICCLLALLLTSSQAVKQMQLLRSYDVY